MEIWYEWRELSPNGILIEPEESGPYYERDRMKNGYTTEQEAMEEYQQFSTRNPWTAPREMVLLKFFRPTSNA